MNNFDMFIQLEKQLLEHSVRKNPGLIDQLIADDFIEFATSGNIYTKLDILEQLPEEEHATWEAYDFRVVELSAEIVQVTFKTKRQNKYGFITSSLRSSLWKLNCDQWQMFFHQGTKTS